MMTPIQSAPTKSKYQHIFESLSADIRERRFAPGDKLPAEAELVSQFGASRPTVARAVRELVRKGLVVRRVGAGTFVRKPAIDQLVFGLLVPTQGDSEIFDPICKQIGSSLQAKGHSLLWPDGAQEHGGRLSASEARRACDDFINSGISGLFFVPFKMPGGTHDPNPEIAQTLKSSGIEVVLLDRDIVHVPDRSQFDVVSVDHVRGTARITDHLVGLGHRNIAFWTQHEPSDTMQLRLAGLFSAAARHHLSLDHTNIHRCNPSNHDEVQKLLATRHPTAIICQNDEYAAHLLRTLFSLGIRIPEDLSVVGFDDVQYSSLLHVALTTASQPCDELGAAAARVMLGRLAQPDLPPREILITPELTVRESTAAPASP